MNIEQARYNMIEQQIRQSPKELAARRATHRLPGCRLECIARCGDRSIDIGDAGVRDGREASASRRIDYINRRPA